MDERGNAIIFTAVFQVGEVAFAFSSAGVETGHLSHREVWFRVQPPMVLGAWLRYGRISHQWQENTEAGSLVKFTKNINTTVM